MKQYIIFLISFFIIGYAKAQSTSAHAVQISQKIAKRLKDSLGLNESQCNNIYDANMSLHQQKQQARVTHAGNMPALTTAIQAIENTRDSLYVPILTEAQLAVYKQKKARLLKAN